MKHSKGRVALVVCAIMLLGLFVMTGCGSGRAASAKDIEFLTASEYWYHYDEVTGEYEKMSFNNDMSMEVEVIDYSDYHLLLRVDGEVKAYTYIKTGLDIADSEKYMAGYSGEFSVLGGSVEEIVLGPFDYDGDIEYPDNAVKTYELTDDFEAYSLNTFKHIIDGEVVEDTVDYKQLTMKESVENMEYSGYGFIWFNDEMQVEKVLFYGDTIVEE